MAGRGRKLVIEMTADTKGVKAGTKQVETATGRMGKSVSKTSGAVKTAMSVVAAGAVVAFGKNMVEHAAVMESIGSRTDQVFGSSAAAVRDWASESASAMGLSQLGAMNLANELGDLLVPLGLTRAEAAEFATETLNAANALSEWTGGQVSVEEAASAVTKAMLGEREELKKLGIKIGETDVNSRLAAKGQGELEGKAKEAAKAIATQELIMEKSADALAAYAEGGNEALQSQKDLASQTAELKDSLAKLLAPALNTVVDGLGDMASGAQVILKWFADLSPTVKTVALGIAGLSAALALVYANPVVAGLALVAGAVILIGKESEAAEEAVRGLEEALRGEGFDEAKFAEIIGPDQLQTLREFGVSLGDLNAAVSGSTADWDAFAEKAIAAAGGVQELHEVAPGVIGSMQQFRAELAPVVDGLQNEEQAALAAGDATDFLERRMRTARAGAGKYAGEMEEVEEVVIDTTDATYDYISALQEAADPAFHAAAAAQRFSEMLEEAEEDEKITAEEARNLAGAWLEAQGAADQVSAANIQAATDAMNRAVEGTDAEVDTLIGTLRILDRTDATAHASVKVDRSGLRSAEEVIEQFNRVTKRRIEVRMTARAPSQGTINRLVRNALRHEGRLGGHQP